ncbi:MAG: PEP-CTERM sorting domain-containing protein [Cyanobacteria bacterium P01_E01_bin.42]
MFKQLSLAIATLSAAFVVTGLTAESSRASSLVNGDFENPFVRNGTFRFNDASIVPGWKTTDTRNHIEIWGDGFLGVNAAVGRQFAELNAQSASTIFQDVTDIDAGLEVGFEFYHRARKGTDVMSLEITDLGQDNIFGTLDDTSLFYNTYSATTAAWVYNTNESEDAIITLGNTLRFAYGAVSTGSRNNTVGNFLDAVSFGVGVGAEETQPVPEPASLLGLLVVGSLCASSLKRKKSA